MEYRSEQSLARQTGHYAAHFSGKAKVDSTCWNTEVYDAIRRAEVDVELHVETMGTHRRIDNPAS